MFCSERTAIKSLCPAIGPPFQLCPWSAELNRPLTAAAYQTLLPAKAMSLTRVVNSVRSTLVVETTWAAGFTLALLRGTPFVIVLSLLTTLTGRQPDASLLEAKTPRL